jgi:hypothetical protein
MKADSPNTSNQTQITDSGWINSQNGWMGLTPNTEVGDIIRVIQGTSRGQLRKITGNTATGFNWDYPMLLDETSVWITEKAAWDPPCDSSSLENSDYQHQATLNVPVDNWVNRSIVIASFTVDVNGVESPDGDNPIREDWIYGQVGTGEGTGGSTTPLNP